MARRKSGLHFYTKKKKISMGLIKEIASWLFFLVVAVFCAFVFVYSVGMKTTVIGASMEPVLYNSEEVLINRFVYTFHAPRRGDVIVFLPHGNQNTHYYIKRVIGLPGEKITIEDGRILIDGYFFEESDVFDRIEDGGIAKSGVSLGENEYFVLGDNRNNSEDSRSANIGAVAFDDIAGKAWLHLGIGKEGIGLIE